MFFLLTNISHLMRRLNRKLVVNWFKHLSCSSIYALERKQKLGFLLRVHITAETGSSPGALWWLILMGEHFDWKSSWLRFIWQFGAWFLSLVGADPVMMIAVTSVRESQGPPETFPTCMISVTWSLIGISKRLSLSFHGWKINSCSKERTFFPWIHPHWPLK